MDPCAANRHVPYPNPTEAFGNDGDTRERTTSVDLVVAYHDEMNARQSCKVACDSDSLAARTWYDYRTKQCLHNLLK